MCGRFASYFEAQELAEFFQVTHVTAAAPPSWNVAPAQPISVVRAIPGTTAAGGAPPARELFTARWGLVGAWAKDPSIGPKPINARSETVTTKPMFRAAARTRRALIPAAGYYEWTPTPGAGKTPYYLHPEPEGQPIALAGLYEDWRGEGTEILLTTATIITRPATDTLGQIHDRMPVVVPPEFWADWLDPELERPAQVQQLLDALPAPQLYPRQVGRAVGSVMSNGPSLIQPA
ncbi:MAG: SOS response-associated peptidase [Bifidobacteriaceae bacterium]|jgi:putative SOS response-associated peptidase YedK|nr:SOS response-associated peptidase [Bifidobacteriaceae bacterium]